MANRPVNFNDPTGHMQDNDDDIKDNDNQCNSGDKASDKGCDSLKKKMEGKKQLRSCIERNNNYLNCDLPRPTFGPNPPYFPGSDINYPPISDLHPSDFILPPSKGERSPVYSPDGKLLGYRDIYYIADVSSVDAHFDLIDIILNGLTVASVINAVKSIPAAAACPYCDAALVTAGTLRFLDQSITMNGNAEYGLLVPIHDVNPLDLEPMTNPFDPYIRPK